MTLRTLVEKKIIYVKDIAVIETDRYIYDDDFDKFMDKEVTLIEPYDDAGLLVKVDFIEED